MTSVDPTRINIKTDPTSKRMRGVAYHGNTPFDVPFISRISYNLWQGGCENGLVLPEFIDHVVSLYPWEKYTINHEVLSEQYIEMYDSTDQAFDQVDEIAREVNKLRKSGQVLVHCQAGLNRSSLIAARALYLFAKDVDGVGVSGAQVIDHLRAMRSPACLCNPSFEAEVRSWS
ncbi:dual specificity protein phosphatase family protein [Mycolicibacterium sp. S2-37]|uniref:protein-tyrosine phosphatase family protein n=1 Tax=Mycolicibacterium sp. S2-37 TaxID=2810297 RepID=UPI001A947746|nr:protein-tyrosine phosphatase family protein [Mycolicibacterium sp. S2-37]MBO0676873.1 dual specificity protein phosphatase family protein [Mycolicibacterium sp. S2-37]